MNKEITFMVKLRYGSEMSAPICEESAKENLYDAIENERMNGALGTDDIIVENLSISIVQ